MLIGYVTCRDLISCEAGAGSHLVDEASSVCLYHLLVLRFGKGQTEHSRTLKLPLVKGLQSLCFASKLKAQGDCPITHL